MIAVTPASRASCGPSGKGKNASEASTAPSTGVAVLAGLVERDLHGLDAAHLAGADAERLQVLGDDDRVRVHVLADAPGEEEVAPELLVGLVAGANLHPFAVVHLRVGVLHEEAADHAAKVALAEGRAPALAVLEDPRSGLLLEDLDRVGRVLGRDQHLDELLGQALRERRVDAAVDRDDAAVG